MASYNERLGHAGNSNKLHGALRRYAEENGFVREPRRLNPRIVYNNGKGKENSSIPGKRNGKKLQS